MCRLCSFIFYILCVVCIKRKTLLIFTLITAILHTLSFCQPLVLFRINLCMCIVYRVRIDWVSEQHATLFMRNLFNSLYFVFDLELYIYQIYSECEKYLCIYLCILRALNCGIEFREFCSLYFVVTFEFYVDRSKKYFFFFFITSSFA